MARKGQTRQYAADFSDPDGLAARGHDVVVGAQDGRQSFDERRPIASFAAPFELRLEDLRATLQQPAKEREVLPFRHALVSTFAQVIERQIAEPHDESRIADAIDATVYGVVLHERDATPRPDRASPR